MFVIDTKLGTVVSVVWGMAPQEVIEFIEGSVGTGMAPADLKAVKARMKRAGGCTAVASRGEFIVVWLKKEPANLRECGGLYHEISHVVDAMLRKLKRGRKGLNGIDEGELRATIFEYLVVKCHECLWKKAMPTLEGRSARSPSRRPN